MIEPAVAVFNHVYAPGSIPASVPGPLHGHFSTPAYVNESMEVPRKYFDKRFSMPGVESIVFCSSCTTYGCPVISAVWPGYPRPSPKRSQESTNAIRRLVASGPQMIARTEKL
jgi:hypothetical protein